MSKPPIIQMVYAILTTPGKGGMPFDYGDTAPTAPGETLRVAPNATLIGFENQPDSVFASKDANAFGLILWQVTGVTLHPDDLADAKTFSTYREFHTWLWSRENG